MNIQEFFSNIIESMPSALITVDSDLTIKQINTNALRISQASEENVLNKSVFASFPMLESYESEIKVSLTQNATVTLDRVEFVNQELNNYYKVTCYPLDAIDNVIVIQIDDITQRELLEQRILQTEKMHSLDGLAAGIAHEVNNPLSAIINGIQNIKRRLDPARKANLETANKIGLDLDLANAYLQEREIKFFLDSIEEGAFRASNIVSNMLKFSKPDSYSREPCDINLLLEQSINFVLKDYELQNDTSLANIEFEYKLGEHLPKIEALPLELQQVFVNLIRNAEQAIKLRSATGDDAKHYSGKITLETKLEDNNVIVIIADNGSGMTDEVVRKAFDPYFSTRHKSGGHGLGLSTVYRIIKSLLGGEIEVRSALNIGTQFIITLQT